MAKHISVLAAGLVGLGLSLACSRLPGGSPAGGDGGDGQRICPTKAEADFHQMTVQFESAIPAKIGVVVDGMLKFSECGGFKDVPPYVRVQRAPKNTVIITVKHWGAYQQPPQAVSFSVLDQGDCSQQPLPIFEIADAPLEFKPYSAGPGCQGGISAKTSFVQKP